MGLIDILSPPCVTSAQIEAVTIISREETCPILIVLRDPGADRGTEGNRSFPFLPAPPPLPSFLLLPQVPIHPTICPWVSEDALFYPLVHWPIYSLPPQPPLIATWAPFQSDGITGIHHMHLSYLLLQIEASTWRSGLSMGQVEKLSVWKKLMQETQAPNIEVGDQYASLPPTLPTPNLIHWAHYKDRITQAQWWGIK